MFAQNKYSFSGGKRPSFQARISALFPNAEWRPLPPRSGFTLVETAMVIVIIGLVMLTVFPALNAVRMAGQVQVTQSNLHSLMVATAAYVQANGCLPCPASPAIVGVNFGRMNYASTAAACGTCSAAEGIPPFVALGIPWSTAHDGWGHWITMRVDPALTTAFGVVPPYASCQCSDFTLNSVPLGCTSSQVQQVSTPTTSGCTAVNASQKGMCQSKLPSSGRIRVTIPGGATQQAAVIFVSHGTTGYGSYFAQPLARAATGIPLSFTSEYSAICNPGAGTFAVCNGAQTNSTQFYDAPHSTIIPNPYDDSLAYADRNTLVSMFGNGSCQTQW